MLESKQSFAITDEKTIERLIDDENVNINHMVLNTGESLPEHYSNSNVYMIVVRGIISLQLDEQDTHRYPQGSIISIPFNIKMNVYNEQKETLEFFVVKSPCPKNYNKYADAK